LDLSLIGAYAGTASSPLSGATAIVGQGVKLAPGGTGLFVFYDSATQTPLTGGGGLNQYQFAIALVPSGHIQIWRQGVGSFQDLGANLYPAGTYFYFGIRASCDPSGGAVILELNGVTIANLAGLNTRGGSVSRIDSFMYHSNGTFGPLIDDFYICDVTGSSPFNGFLGPVRVYTRFPSSAASTQFTPLTSTNVSQIKETSMDSDTSYNFSSTVGQSDLFNADSIPSGAPPLACKVTAAARQDSSGSRSLQTLLKTSSTTSGGAGVALSQTYAYQSDIYTQDPDAGPGAWTNSSVNASQIGYSLTA
jgi:hypothetical protein